MCYATKNAIVRHLKKLSNISPATRNAGLVSPDCYREYKFTGCLVPGYPDLCPWQEQYWELFWRIYNCVRADGLVRQYPQKKS